MIDQQGNRFLQVPGLGVSSFDCASKTGEPEQGKAVLQSVLWRTGAATSASSTQRIQDFQATIQVLI